MIKLLVLVIAVGIIFNGLSANYPAPSHAGGVAT